MPKMKDSGIEWIGESPSNWTIERGKYHFVQKTDKGNNKALVLLSPTQNYGVIPQELYEQLSGFSAVKLNEKTDFNTLKTVHKGAFVISLRSFQGGFEYSEYEGVVSPAYQVFYPSVPIYDYYYKYLFKTQAFIEKMNSYTMSLRDGKNIAFADFGRTYIPVPPLEEQKKIADFLDLKCFEIDCLSDDIQKQIAVLEEYKKSVITEAVTKGLNPDVEMKDSGIEWIGMIPKHWCVKRGKYVFDIFGGSISDVHLSYEPIESWKDIYYFKVEDMNKTTSGFDMVYGTKLYTNITANPFIAPLILVPKRGAAIYTNKVRVANQDCFIDPNIMALQVKENIYYIAYVLYGRSLVDIGDITTIPQINNKHINELILPVPSEEEQEEIVTYLNVKCGEISEIILQKREQLEILEQYKKSLIYEYVTGKKEVPSEETVVPNAILLGVIISKLGQLQSGRIQTQKILYLSNMHLHLNQNVRYARYNHGPYDLLLNDYIDTLKKNNWFKEIKNKAYILSEGDNYSDFQNTYKEQITTWGIEIDKLIRLLESMNVLKSSRLERITTLYAAWNDFLLDGIEPTDDQLIKEVMTNWTDNKGNIQYATWQDSLNKMKKNGLVPAGTGMHTVGKQQKEEC